MRWNGHLEARADVTTEGVDAELSAGILRNVHLYRTRVRLESISAGRFDGSYIYDVATNRFGFNVVRFDARQPDGATDRARFDIAGDVLCSEVATHRLSSQAAVHVERVRGSGYRFHTGVALRIGDFHVATHARRLDLAL